MPGSVLFGTDYTLGDLEFASRRLLSNPQATIPIWDPELEDTFQVRVFDLLATASGGDIMRIIREMDHGDFLEEYEGEMLSYGRQTLVRRPGKNNVLVTEVGSASIHPISIEIVGYTPGPNGGYTPESVRMVTYNPSLDTVAELTIAGGSGAFNGDRVVRTTPQIGVNYGGKTTSEWIDRAFFGFLGAQIALAANKNSFELGTSLDVRLDAFIVPRDETVISERSIRRGAMVIATSIENRFYATETIEQSTVYTLSIRVGGQGSPHTIVTNINIDAIAPIFYGAASVAQLQNQQWVQGNAKKSLAGKNETTLSFDSVNQRPFIAIPAAYGDIRAIEDVDRINIRGSFIKYQEQEYYFGQSQEVVEYIVFYLNADYTGANAPLTLKY